MSAWKRGKALLVAMTMLIASGCQSTPQTKTDRPYHATYAEAAIACDHPLASDAGAEMLRRGGNAVDAAVAASFMLSVVRPYSCGLGGGGFMIIHRPAMDGRLSQNVALNYRETAPAAVGRDYFERIGAADDPTLSQFGPHAVGVPGSVAGLLTALEEHGSLPRPIVIAPAIAAAKKGFRADANWVEAAEVTAARLEEHPHLRPGAEFVWKTLCLEGRVKVGDRIRNPAQAEALMRIAEHGRAGFYEGPVAAAIVLAVQGGGGPLTLDDLARYTPRTTAPLRGDFAEHTILSMPPPSSGGVAMIQMLGIIERHWDVVQVAANFRSYYVQLLTEAMKHAFADRAEFLADPDFVEVPVHRLISNPYLDKLSGRIDLERTSDRFVYGSAEPAPDDGGTSHLSVIDKDGMAVACTETINLRYGSLVAVPEFGFVLNDQMDDFTVIPGAANHYGLKQSDRNLPAAGKRPLSSMAPTIVLRGDRPVLVAGASGGPRIISATLQCILNCLVRDMTAVEAVDAPRLHHQWVPEVVEFEDAWTERDVIEQMERRGHEVGRRRHVGKVQLLFVTEEGIEAVSDPRKGGAPAGH